MAKFLISGTNLFISIIRNVANKFLELTNLILIYRTHNAIGDVVCLTAVIKNIHMQLNRKTIVISPYPCLFKNNPYVFFNIDINKLLFLSVWKKILYNLEGNFVKHCNFKNINNMDMETYLRHTKLKISLIEIHALHFDYKLNLKDAIPELFFSKTELIRFSKKFGYLKNYSIITPIGKTSYTPNKEWGFEKFQEVINITHKYIKWVQTGLKTDKILENAIDLRGKTTVRELAYIIRNANFTLSNEGLINHLAASVKTKSYVIFSGFTPIEIALYPTTIAIYVKPEPKCAPCWLLTKCPQTRRICVDNISINDVLMILEEY